MVEEHHVEIRLTLRDLRSIRHLEIDNECMPSRKRSDGMIEMNAIATESTVASLRKMRKRDVRVEVLSDWTDEITSVKQLVSPTNRYADGSLPRGAGKSGS